MLLGRIYDAELRAGRSLATRIKFTYNDGVTLSSPGTEFAWTPDATAVSPWRDLGAFTEELAAAVRDGILSSEPPNAPSRNIHAERELEPPPNMGHAATVFGGEDVVMANWVDLHYDLATHGPALGLEFGLTWEEVSLAGGTARVAYAVSDLIRTHDLSLLGDFPLGIAYDIRDTVLGSR